MTCQVRFDYYDLLALTVAADFANTRSEPTGADELLTAADLVRFLRRYTDLSILSDPEQTPELDLDRIAALYANALARWTPVSSDVEELRRVRQFLRNVFETGRTDPGRAVQTVNEALARYRALPRVSAEHDEPHMHFEAAEDGIVHWLTVSMLMGLAIFICDGNAARLGVCASMPCLRVFIDRSKNSQKKYCSDVCAHRESVAAFRARQKYERHAP